MINWQIVWQLNQKNVYIAKKLEYILSKQSFRIYERMIRLMENQIKKPGLYNSEFEHDACGIGAIVSINGIKTHQTV